MVRYQALKGLYEVDRTIGCGGFAKVKVGAHISTGEKVAIKIMDKAALDSDLPRVKLELKALQTLSHENICKLFQVIETETHFFLIMEYCSGGELFDHIIEKNRLSESESRMFFRQIVSAVAYLHSSGFAHRDLKPENVLLDKYQNLKLIDFGLCANPDGGMTSPLLTSCGSPTYAAPELVMGRQYLGAEVDIWAMGVLLYALLSGTLPFDDVSIDALYKKILSGKYHEPAFMSKESLSLLRSMLQVDPNKRITIKELLSHPWLTLGILDPVNFRGDDPKVYDKQCVEIMAKQHQIDPHTMWCKLKQWNYDYHTATYLILLMRKKRQSPLKLSNNMASKIIWDSIYSSTPETPAEKGAVSTPICQVSTPTNGFVEPHTRRALKRVRSPIPEDKSPIPTKKLIKDATRMCTPNKERSSDTVTTPGSARKVLGSIERSFQKVVNVLTPRKTDNCSVGKPTQLTSKDLSNVSTTQCCSPEYVINRLSKALERKGIFCKRKGFKLQGKTQPISGSVYGECSFELEICYLPNLGTNSLPTGTNTPTKSILKNVPLSVFTAM
ncbi:unnamed protein product [Acanthoscelides obtectus]|uniref:non-specific serine/threonine protein kinase n=1 Tax=Acanthoscelides obtectus TaxID=200917 RepID=A0A9P0PUI3_ACAOB|nr:unnamed protein product [Acanthoscelides obtectus]CAK1632698.1 Maternal embryonic leucine zipper kinase [Acanthoscelides obtectus]